MPRFGLRLTIWSLVAFGFFVGLIVSLATDDWVGVAVALPVVLFLHFMLMTGLWMSWPRV